LAIHLDRQEAFSFNKETQLLPIAGLIAAELNRAGGGKELDSKENNLAPLKTMLERHHPYLVELIALELAIEPADLLDFEMLLFDTQEACLGGMLQEFIFSPRLDNLNMSYCATMGLINSVADASALKGETSIRLVALFDHEEIGSLTAQGAHSNFLPAIIRRLSVLPPSSFANTCPESSFDKESREAEFSTTYEQTLSTSFLLSADMAHAVHPNYSSKYEADHRPEINKGPVIKVNANARYATNAPGIALLQEVALKAGEGDEEFVPLQLFVVRNDSSCGGTIGPMLSAALGTRTLDMGNPQLSMHSIRETGGSEDVHHAIRLFTSFFKHYSKLLIFVD
jgi:aspartyl aminopeptidase